MQNYTLIMDTWSGQGDIDEKLLWDGGVRGLITRLNSVYGDPVKDPYFDTQWAQSEIFTRWPYYVYDPWRTGLANYNWLGRNMPPNCPVVMVDDELNAGNPDGLAREFDIFRGLVAKTWKRHIYTGGWFLPFMSRWPKDEDYLWAQYPYIMHYRPAKIITFEILQSMLDDLIWPPTNAAMCPGPLKAWQCSGDSLILPGSNGKPIDIVVFPGTEADLRIWLGYDTVILPTFQEVLEDMARKHGYQWRQ